MQCRYCSLNNLEGKSTVKKGMYLVEYFIDGEHKRKSFSFHPRKNGQSKAEAEIEAKKFAGNFYKDSLYEGV